MSDQRSAISNQLDAKLTADKLKAESSGSAKDPAAVALGKRRQASMSAEERRAWARAGAKATNEWQAKRSPLERRESARKGVRTRRLRPAWMRKRKSNQQSVVSTQPPAPVSDAAELARLLETASDEAIARLAAVIRQPA